jgi:hypothetical protein
MVDKVKSHVWQDKNNWTHIDWELDGVTSKMLNWFWSNMEKGDNLWHPDQHMDFGWFVSMEEAGGPRLNSCCSSNGLMVR